MTGRALVVPAAGPGSRLKAAGPKALVEVNGRPMLDYLADLYGPYVDGTIVVAHPSAVAVMERWARASGDGRTEIAQQPAPTGMLDAILLSTPAVLRLDPDWVWISWGDQVGVLPETISRLAEVTAGAPPPALALPTVPGPHPYTHFQRAADGRITALLQKREGDPMPEQGESDMGVFALSRECFEHHLPGYAREVLPGQATGERNFLPFVAWLSARARVVTFPCTDPMEAIGINTPEDLRVMEQWLRTRAS